jgi:hypothetical protein
MTYLLSRANYDRCTAGMDAFARAAFDRDFAVYPDRVSPDGDIDLNRIAEAWDALQAAQRPAPKLWFTEPSQPTWPQGWPSMRGWPKDPDATEALWLSMGKGNGKSNWRAPEPWREVGPGVYVAPPGTPSPLFTPEPSGPPEPAGPALWHQDAPEAGWPDPGWPEDFGRWIAPDELTNDMLAEQPRRYMLNNQVTGPRSQRGWGNPLDDAIAWLKEYQRLNGRPQVRLIKAGAHAMAGLQFAVRPAEVRFSDKRMVEIQGIPIVADPDLPDDVYRLVDPTTGDILFEGVIGLPLAEMMRVVREAVDHLAEVTGIPRDLLY